MTNPPGAQPPFASQTSLITNPRWLSLFESFVSHIRIPSKEVERFDPRDRGVPLTLWGTQRRYMEELAAGLTDGQRTFFFLKGRQLGISTISIALDLFWVSFFPGTQGVIVIDTDPNRQRFRALLKTYLASFPKGFFGSSFGIIKGHDNRDSIGFTNGSVIDFLVAGKSKGANRNKTLGESRGYSFAHLSELANFGSPEGIQSFRETLAEKHPNRLFIYESTAKGYNLWRDLYYEGLRDPITKRSVFIGWYHKEINSLNPRGPAPEPRLYQIYGADPPTPEERERMKIVLQTHNHAITQQQLAWYRWRQSDTSTTKTDLAQNQPWFAEEAFQLSGQSFFQNRLVGKHMERLQDPEQGYFHGYRFFLGSNFLASKLDQVMADVSQVELRVFEEPTPRGTYVIGCDPAWGRAANRDRSCISVWRCYADCLIQVAEYASNATDTRQVAWILAYLAGAYRNCTVNIEITGGSGLAVLGELKSVRNQLQQEQFLDAARDTPWEDFLLNARWYIFRRYDVASNSGNVTQWQTTQSRKWEILNQFRDTMAKNELIPYSWPLLDEMLSVVVTEDGKIEAPGGNKDDRVFAAALANRTWIDQVRPALLAANATYANVHANAPGTETGMEGMANRMVQEFFKRAEIKAQEAPRAPEWMRLRGLA